MDTPLESSNTLTEPPTSSLSPLVSSNGVSSSTATDNDADSHNGKDKMSNRSFWKGVCPPPSFNYNNNNTTRPYYLFPLFFLINIVTMTDRSIIAGASQEFSAFISSAHDSPQFVHDNPDAGIGLLQASFIFGYAISLVLSGHYVHKIRWKPMVFISLCVWWLGVLGSGNAKQYNSFYVLLFSRMATGCSEAAFQVVAPPLIQDRGREHAGLWLSIYLTGLPLGLALGYVYGSNMAGSEKWGWDWAYYFMCIASLPLLAVFGFVKDDTILGAEDDGKDTSDSGRTEGSNSQQPLLQSVCETDLDDDEEEPWEHPPPTSGANNTCWDQCNEDDEIQQPKKEFTLFNEIMVCFSSPVLVTLSLGWAAIIGIVASLGTFGASFTLALQLYDDERDAAYWFGIAAAVAGVVGTPLGGSLADEVLERFVGKDIDHSRRDEGIDENLRYPIISSMLPRINLLVAAAMCFVFPTLAMQDTVFFLTFLFIGWTLLFMTQTSITMVAMLSVDHCDRPNALAFLMLTSHLLGDVPLPIVLGLIKDSLAPDCVIDGTTGEFKDTEKCKEQHAGIRQTLAIAYAWVLWALFFFELARRLAKREIRKARSEEHNTLLLQEEHSIISGDTPRASTFQYYHSKFTPHQPAVKTSGTDSAKSENGGLI